MKFSVRFRQAMALTSEAKTRNRIADLRAHLASAKVDRRMTRSGRMVRIAPTGQIKAIARKLRRLEYAYAIRSLYGWDQPTHLARGIALHQHMISGATP